MRFSATAQFLCVVLFHSLATICNAQTALPQPTSLLDVDGVVHASLVLPNGQILIAGSFSAIDNVARSNIARLNQDGSLDTSWNAVVDDSVDTLAASSDTLYVGGKFLNIGGQPRAHIGAIDLAAGSVSAWNPGADNEVIALAASNNIVYAGGLFTTLGGQSRAHIGAMDATSGLATSWNPGADESVYTIAVLGDDVFAGGSFATIGGQPRAAIGAISATTGFATVWNPQLTLSFPSAFIRCIAISGNTVYASGYFSAVGNAARAGIAAIDATSGTATTWNPAIDGTVEALAISGGLVYAAGDFANVGGQPHIVIVSIDASTGLPTNWNPVTSSYRVTPPNFYDSISVSGGTIFLGGSFRGFNGNATGGLARIDAVSGAMASSPGVQQPGNVGVMREQPDGKVIIGGRFQSINDVARANIARLNADGSVDLSWNPGANSGVYAIALLNNVVYAGGGFTMIGGQSRAYIAGIDATTGLATPWNPSADDLVSALTIAGNTVYVGGSFANLGGLSRTAIGAVDATSGLATPFSTYIFGDTGGYGSPVVFAISIQGNTLYIGGSFTSVGGQARTALAALDATTGSPTAWDPGINVSANTGCEITHNTGEVRSLALSGGTIFVAGSFDYVGGQQRSCLAALDLATGAATTWNPNVVGERVVSIALSGSTLYAAGSFNGIGGKPRQGLAALDTETGFATDWDPGAQLVFIDSFGFSGVANISLVGDAVYVGGGFSSVVGQQRIGIAALTATDEIFHGEFE
jgi:uncharacterized delta-60 repeat protein